ncbi:RagB/SusD family nutrient uptake outer membrane protein [Snuella sedimenti]|uniref:RagB/SusD family nutrient uptake outer membrane protein n=1 Tax=Snuella sedimenti TaxID=2798802 RepID=A0A8J7LUG1_9FLAO|nr:RagB/SusD family nutrient uptake outer membrane protein [Snuella sedimenti]MBJ6369606.1 RagB/SusD family nutrient uptake outer membrane protein [Snuella sedimenti]
MKKHIIYFTLILTLFSCDYLDFVPDDVATIDDAFDDQKSAETFLFTCYSWMPNLGDKRNNPALLGGDEVAYPLGAFSHIEDLQKVAVHEIAMGFQSPDNPYTDYWTGANGGKNLYSGIRDCNIFLEKINEVPYIDEFLKKRWIAEVKFLKAYYHFFLFRMYGPIVLVPENVEVDAEVDEFHQFRSPIDECSSFIVNLLNEAAPDLPLVIGDIELELGRATKVAALALKAKTLVWTASPLFNGNDEVSNLVDSRGIRLFPSTVDSNKWNTAADACKQAIDAANEANIALFEYSPTGVPLPTGTTIDDLPNEILKVITLNTSLTERWTDEKLFVSTEGRAGTALQNMGMGRAHSRFESNIQVTGHFSPSLSIAEQFYSKNGVPIDEDITWDYANMYKLRTYNAATDVDDNGNGVADNLYYIKDGETTVNFHFDREPRFYASLGFDRGIWFGNPATYSNRNPGYTDHYLEARAGEYAGNLLAGRYSTTGYIAKKVAYFNNSIRNSTSGLTVRDYPFPEIRLSGLYLFYAECLNEIDNQSLAIEYIDKVRERAGLKGVLESWSTYSNQPNKPSTKSGLRQIIQDERLNELAFEGQRFWDIRRWKLAEELQRRPQKGWNTEGKTAEDYYTPVTVFVLPYSFKNNLFPIPTEELLRNPNLVQNPGW